MTRVRTYSDIRYRSPDGLSLYARDYAGQGHGLPLLCMHGLSRNSADFEMMAELLPDYRIISVDQRGRGDSDWDPDKSNYRPDVYCQDMFTLLDNLGLDKVVAIGTSMGGLMTMMMAQMRPGVFRAAVINDIGPEIDTKGLARLRGYVGTSPDFDSWDAAAVSVKMQGPDIFPEFRDADWLAFARRTCRETPDKRIKFNYDPAIGEGVKGARPGAVSPDLWPVFAALDDVPLLLIRGETSDILPESTAHRMADRHPDCRLVTIGGRGHAPLLDEPDAIRAMSGFLEENP